MNVPTAPQKAPDFCKHKTSSSCSCFRWQTRTSTSPPSTRDATRANRTLFSVQHVRINCFQPPPRAPYAQARLDALFAGYGVWGQRLHGLQSRIARRARSLGSCSCPCVLASLHARTGRNVRAVPCAQQLLRDLVPPCRFIRFLCRFMKGNAAQC